MQGTTANVEAQTETNLSETVMDKVRTMELKRLASGHTKADETDGQISIQGFFRAVFDELGRDIPYTLFSTAFYDMDMPVDHTSIGSDTRCNKQNHATFQLANYERNNDYRISTRSLDINNDYDRLNAYITVSPQNTTEKATLIAIAERYDDVYVYRGGGNKYVIAPARNFIQ